MQTTCIEANYLKPGDHVEVIGLNGWFEVIDVSDPALIRLRTDAGKEFQSGRVCVTRVMAREEA